MDDVALTPKSFGTVDLVVFVGILCVSLLVGVYYAFKDRSKQTTDNYYFGERSMSPIPVGLSISVTYISALTVIGFPTEAYGYGTVLLWYSVTAMIANAVVCVYYIPIIRRLKVASIYQYLEMRFNQRIRVLESIISNLSGVFYMGITIYLPSLALSAVIPLGLKLNIILTSTICVLYTTLGGMKAVVWTDTLQTFVMCGGMFATLIKAIVDVGGLGEVWEALERGERLTAFNFNPDPTYPYTFWTLLIGQSVAFCGIGTSQALCQRFLACRTLRETRIAVGISIVLSSVLFIVASLSGCVMYAYFEGCDPLKTGEISKSDQLMPYLAVSIFQTLPGFAGLFVSAAFSGTLSTVSSGINACGALVIEDYILPCFPNIKETTKLTLSKVIVLIVGLIVTSFALLIEHIDSTVIQLSFTILGTMSGPMLGIFTLAIFFPWCTTKGAFIGQITSTLFIGTMGIVSLVKGRSPEKYGFLPTSVDMCKMDGSANISTNIPIIETSTANHFFNYTTDMATNPALVDESSVYVTGLFALSHLYYSVVSIIITVLVGMTASLILGANDPTKSDPKLFLPFVDNKLLPEKVRVFFRFGVPPLNEENESANSEEKHELCSTEDSNLKIDAKSEKSV